MNRQLIPIVLVVLTLFAAVPTIAQTFTFVQAETTFYYTDPNQTYEFHGSVTNLLQSTRILVYELTPVSYPDTARQSAICTFLGCYPPQSGHIIVNQEYEGGQVDDSVKFYIYNTRCDWTPGWCSPVEAPLDGDQSCDVTVYSSDDPNERITYRLNLIFGEGDLRIVPSLVPTGMALMTNYPNPFNGETTIRFEVPLTGFISLQVFDVLGRRIASLFENVSMAPGTYETSWNASTDAGVALPSGSYIVSLAASGQSAVHTITLIR